MKNDQPKEDDKPWIRFNQGRILGCFCTEAEAINTTRPFSKQIKIVRRRVRRKSFSGDEHEHLVAREIARQVLLNPNPTVFHRDKLPLYAFLLYQDWLMNQKGTQ